MTIETMVTIGLLGLSTILSVFSFIKTGKRKSSNTTSTTENSEEQVNGDETSCESDKSFMERFKETLYSLLNNIDLAENLFNAISTGKTGNLKLSQVLDKIKLDFLSQGKEYDNEFWTEIVNSLVCFTKQVNK